MQFDELSANRETISQVAFAAAQEYKKKHEMGFSWWFFQMAWRGLYIITLLRFAWIADRATIREQQVNMEAGRNIESWSAVCLFFLLLLQEASSLCVGVGDI